MSASKMTSYPKYKSISHAGIEKIPDHWDSKRMRYVFKERGEVSEDGTEELLSVSKYTGVRVRSTTTDREARAASLVGYKKCEPNDIVSNIMLAWDSALGVAFDSGIVSSAYEVYVPQQEIDPHFLDLLLRTPEYRVAFTIVSKGIVPSRWRMYTESFNDIQMILPPLKEQKQIGRFVSRVDENISRNIGNLETQISMLEEKRSAFITQALTKGLNPDVAMKNSGVNGLGRIPEHWDLSQLRWIKKPGSSITYGIVQAGPDIEGGIPYIRVSDMSGDVLPQTGYKRTSEEIDDSYSRSRVLPGDLVITIRASIGKTLIVPEYLTRANLTQGTAKLSVREDISNQFVFWALQSQPSLEELWNQSKGATFKEITLEVLRKHWIVLPPFEEQLTIVEYVNKLTQIIDISKKLIQEKIVMLQEYRTSLISAAVIGKIDVQSL